MEDQQHTAASPGRLHLSDLAPPLQNSVPLSLPRKLEPLQQGAVGVRAAKTRRKRTRRKKRGTEEQEQRGSLDGSEGSGEILEHSDPLLDASTLQQMQARLDPLYSVATDTPLNADHHSIAAASSGSESIPIRDAVEDGKERVQKRKRRRRRATTGAEPVRREREESVEISHHRRRRRRSHRESGSGVSETTAQEAAADETGRVGEERAEVDSSLNHPDSFQGLPVPQYYPPPEEIHDETVEGERMVENAPPPSLPSIHTHPHTSQPSSTVFMERPGHDGRGFVARRKSSSVVPTDDTRCGGATEKLVSSELLAQYSHKFVQRMALTAHGLVAGLSLWDCVVSNVLGSLSGKHLTLLETYHSLSLPAHSLYLLLLSLALLSLVDRLELATLGKQCCQWTLRSLPGLTVLTAAVLTALALLVSLSVAAIDDRISLYPDQPSLWPDIVTGLNLTSTNSTPPPLTTHTPSQHIVYIPAHSDPTTSRLSLWLGLSVFRSICCILGWGLLVCGSDYDRMEEYLLSNGSSGEPSWSPTGSPSTTTGDHNGTSAVQTTATGDHNGTSAVQTTATGDRNTTNPHQTTAPTTLNV